MKILHITSVTNPKGNGVAVAVSNYFFYEKKYVDVALYNVENDIIQDNQSYNMSTYKSISKLPKGFNKPNLVIFNEVYKKAYLNLYKECISNNIPYIVIPHGCLTKKSQNRKKIKKTIANFLFFNKFINNSLAVQYLNETEKEESIVKNHSFIISGNGIEVRKEKAFPFKRKNYVYIGRYDIKVKGLDLLVETVSKNKEWFEKNKIIIDLYGRNTGKGYEWLKNVINSRKINNILILHDAVYGKEKESVILNSYSFIQISRHEGQPMGIMEALSYGLPCIVTYGTTFGKYINDNNCGIGINFDSKELFNAIKKMYDDEKYRDYCSKNSKIVNDTYEWNNIMKKCIKEYKELL